MESHHPSKFDGYRYHVNRDIKSLVMQDSKHSGLNPLVPFTYKRYFGASKDKLTLKLEAWKVWFSIWND